MRLDDCLPIASPNGAAQGVKDAGRQGADRLALAGDPLRKYVTDLRQYLTANGADYIDDRDDPELATIAYADGDHIARDARRRYTEIFYAKLLKLPQ